MDLDKMIECAKTLARPYVWVSIVLAILLFLSLIGNIYLGAQTYSITVDQDAMYSDNNVTSNKIK